MSNPLPPDPAPDLRAVAERAAQLAIAEYSRIVGGPPSLSARDAAVSIALDAALTAHGDALTIDDLHREPYATFAHGDACICDDSLCDDPSHDDPSHDDAGEARRKFYEAARAWWRLGHTNAQPDGKAPDAEWAEWHARINDELNEMDIAGRAMLAAEAEEGGA